MRNKIVGRAVIVMVVAGWAEEAAARYLSPEPMLQDPRYATAMARRGFTVPAYAYAANNPINFFDPNGLAIVVNGSYRSVIVSGNVGAGSGSGGQAFGVVQPGQTGGGVNNPVVGYGSREDALAGRNPLGLITDVDGYDDFNARECSGIKHNPKFGDVKIIGDDEGPIVRITSNGARETHELGPLSQYGQAIERYLQQRYLRFTR